MTKSVELLDLPHPVSQEGLRPLSRLELEAGQKYWEIPQRLAGRPRIGKDWSVGDERGQR